MATHFVTRGEFIQAAVDKAQPGDMIKVEPGTYRERVRFVRSGQHLSPISLSSSGRSPVILDGEHKLKFGLEFGKYGDPECEPVSHIEVCNFEVYRYTDDGIISRPGCHHISLSNIGVFMCGGNGIYLWPDKQDEPGPSGYFIVDNCIASYNDRHGVKVGGSHITLRRITAEWNNPRQIVHTPYADGHGIQVSNRNWNVTVEDCLCAYNWKHGLRYCAVGGEVTGVELHDNGLDGLNVAGGASDVEVKGAHAYCNGRFGVVKAVGVENIKWNRLNLYENAREDYAEETEN